jgi:hypothetical protein
MDSWENVGHTEREGAELLTAVGHTCMYACLSGLRAMKRRAMGVTVQRCHRVRRVGWRGASCFSEQPELLR